MRWYVPEPLPIGLFRSSLFASGLLSLMAGPVFGQASSGQIKGRMTDAATGTPIAGVEVIVAGTTFGNLTNDDGFYFINGVPAGLHTIRATFIGYRTVAVTDERILAGHTNFMHKLRKRLFSRRPVALQPFAGKIALSHRFKAAAWRHA